MQPSLFTRLEVAEAELRAVKDVLHQILDVLADMKANQDAMREEHDQPRAEERVLTARRRPWRRLRNGKSVARAPLPIQAVLTLIRTSLNDLKAPASERTSKDDRAFWKEMGRIAIIGVFLLTIFVIGMYHLLEQS